MSAAFTPPYPHRTPQWASVLAPFFGDRRRNAMYGWPAEAFAMSHKCRSILGLTVHIINDPDAIGRVMLDNKANDVRPDLVLKLDCHPG